MRRKKSWSKKLFFAVLFLGFLGACRGYISENPPIHLNPNMDTQLKGKAYRESNFFGDNTYMREPIEGTVARGLLHDDTHFYEGKVNGVLAKKFPKQIVLNEKLLARGRVVYERTCASCHGKAGDGSGLVGKRLLVPPTSFHSDYLYDKPPGHFFDVIHNGIRTMQPYYHLSTQDKWAVTAHIRVLQLSQFSNGDWIKRSASSWKQR